MRNLSGFDSKVHCRSATSLARQFGASERAFHVNSSLYHEDQTSDGRRRWRALHVRQSSAGTNAGCYHADSHWTDPLVAAESAVFAAVDACRKAASTLDQSAAKERIEILDSWILDVTELLQQRLSESTVNALYSAIVALNERSQQWNVASSATKS
jgi:hypothetical protein